MKIDVVWMSEQPLPRGSRIPAPTRDAGHAGALARISERLDPATQAQVPSTELRLNDIGQVELETAEPLSFDSYRDNRATGGFILVDRLSNLTMGAGLIESSLEDEHHARLAERLRTLGSVRPQALPDRSFGAPELAPALERVLLLRHPHAIVRRKRSDLLQAFRWPRPLVILTTPRPEAAFHASNLAATPLAQSPN